MDGRFGLVGSDARQATAAIQRSIRERKAPITVSHAARNGNEVIARVELAAADQSFKGTRSVLYVALAENRAESHVSRGENAGRLLGHVAVTRLLKQVGPVDLGSAFTKDVSLAVQAGTGTSGWRIVAFIQDLRSGRVLGVAQQKL